MELGAADFASFFRGIHNCNPFPWQQTLVDRLADSNEWPDVLNLPTGSGKTAALDAAVFHLAMRAATPDKAALRIALVVDRRLVVDDAFERAAKIAKVLGAPESVKGGQERQIIAQVADRLRSLAGDNESPLVAQRLRGGVPLEHEWARTPTQPTILCSTVDQVGSRLLFRGYGVSNRMKPIHAGLLGENSLILLDEAHLSEPFRQTLASVQKIGKAGVRTVLLSATPGVQPTRPLALSEEDRAHSLLQRRLKAAKPVRLHKPHEDKETFAKVLADTAGGIADRLQKNGITAPAVGVVVNRVGLARNIFNELKARYVEFDSLLMIGRSRSATRDWIADKLKPFHTGLEERQDAKPLFVVATQCLEVGVDVDLDGLVSQAAPLDSLRQRFGRLNRDGRDINAEGAVLALAEDISERADDPIYEDRVCSTWKVLQDMAEDGNVDFGISLFESRLRDLDTDLTKLVAPQEQAPVLMPAYLGLWSQTSPIPSADPEVGLFLHGVQRMSADVSLVWRGDLRRQDMSSEIDDALKVLMELVPPRAAETLDVPIWVAKQWLSDQQVDSLQLADMADVPGREKPSLDEAGDRQVFRWAGRDDPRTGIVNSSELRPGDLLVVPAEYGGCDSFGWKPDSKQLVEDVADIAAWPYKVKKHAVRITPDIAGDDVRWHRLKTVLENDSDTADDDLIRQFLDMLPSIEGKEPSVETSDEGVPLVLKWRVKALEALLQASSRVRIYRYADALFYKDGAILVAEKGVTLEDSDVPFTNVSIASTESELLSHTASKAVSLDDHGRDVAGWAEGFALKLGLPDSLREDVTLAAYLHDAGKADPRFQIMLSGGDVWNRPDGPVLAKSGWPWKSSARERAGLPDGWRHEALSVRMTLTHPRFMEANDPALVLWLIGTHHGLGRPFFDFVEDNPNSELPACLGIEKWQVSPNPGPQSLAFDYDGADWPNIFETLKQKYGIWKLAHLEAILRLADHRASEIEGSS